jgi:xanthine/CO dehydrogenase XdhC/CoxF family maturation factor
MTTHREIVGALNEAASLGNDVVLATVVRISGSSYGGVGSRMICLADGSRLGLVSGGCLESDLAEHAQRVHATGDAAVVSYDTRDSDEAPWGLGLGCNGLIDVLLEPLSPRQAKAVASLLDHALAADSPSVIATVMRVHNGETDSPRVGAHALFAGDTTETAGHWGTGSTIVDARQYVEEAIAAGRRGVVHTIGSAEVAFEVVVPAIRLVICGVGPDAAPVARFASELGWDATVVDHRPLTEANVARFPGAPVVECDDAMGLANVLPKNRRFAAVVMSHHLARDRDYLGVLLQSDASYIGVLGPRTRTERMLTELIARGDLAAPVDERLHSPIGLDIGGEGPEAIALSIISQIAAVTSHRSGGHLRDRRGALHTPPAPAIVAERV